MERKVGCEGQNSIESRRAIQEEEEEQNHIWRSNSATRNPLRFKINKPTLARSCHSLQRKPVAQSHRQTADSLAARRPIAKPHNSSGLLFVSLRKQLQHVITQTLT